MITNSWSKKLAPYVPFDALVTLDQVNLAYKALQHILGTLEALEEETDSLFQCRLFGFAHDFECKLRTVRTELIQKCAELLRQHMCPNATLDKLDFVEMMNEAVGNDIDISLDDLAACFERLARKKNKSRKKGVSG